MHRRVVNKATLTPPPPPPQQPCSNPQPANKRRRRKQRNWKCLLCFGVAMVIVILLLLPAASLAWRVAQMSRHDFNVIVIRKWLHRRDFYYAPVLPFNPIYTVPHSHPQYGSRADRYVQLRQRVDTTVLPTNAIRETWKTMEAQQAAPAPMDRAVPYDVHNCPDVPPQPYPHLWPTVDILRHWNPNTLQVPAQMHASLCIMDFERDYEKALTYRQHSLPFVVVNDPSVQETAVRWSQVPDFLPQLFGDDVHTTSHTQHTNQFLFSNSLSRQRKYVRHGAFVDKTPADWTKPVTDVRMTFAEFLERAENVSSAHNNDNDQQQQQWYFHVKACGAQANDGSCETKKEAPVEFLLDELPFFQPHEEGRSNRLYLYHPTRHSSGVTCRFGMPGLQYVSHFDRSSNSLALLQGRRRFILSPPSQCHHQALYPYGHPSARHSSLDWTDPDAAVQQEPAFAESQSTDVLLQAGQVLYLPSNWFHFIVTLERNAQCNSWASKSTANSGIRHIQSCGF